MTAFVNKEAKIQTIQPSARRLINDPLDSNIVYSQYLLMWSDGWSLHFSFNDAPYVIIESTEKAELFAKDRPDQTIIANCTKRVDIGSDDDDDMLHFNDFVIIQQAFGEVPHAYVWEAAGCTFQN